MEIKNQNVDNVVGNLTQMWHTASQICWSAAYQITEV